MVAAAVALGVAIIGHPAEFAHDELVAKLAAGEYSRRGADTCLGCHDEDEAFPTLDVFMTVHGHPAVSGSPFEMSGADPPVGLQCEACHGPAGEHDRRILPDGAVREPMVNFGDGANAEADLQNAFCLGCHDNYERAHWAGSAHEAAGLACADCHLVHSAVDAVRAPDGQSRTCTTCHRSVAADALKRSAHPMRDGGLLCRDCHDPHGGLADALARRATVNDTCLACHAELRGPFLWEHAPVVEDCGICHAPHGSNQPALLVRRAPQLCQGCHSSVGHRSFAQAPEDLAAGRASAFLLANACLNCHFAVHGSNHPSGNLFRR